MFIKTQIYPHEWVKLPATTRFLLAETFNLKKSKGVNVVNGEVMSDGYEVSDLAVMNVELLQKFTGSTSEDFIELLNIAINKLENKHSHVIEQKPITENVIEAVENKEVVEELPVVTKKTNAKKGKKAE